MCGLKVSGGARHAAAAAIRSANCPFRPLRERVSRMCREVDFYHRVAKPMRSGPENALVRALSRRRSCKLAVARAGSLALVTLSQKDTIGCGCDRKEQKRRTQTTQNKRSSEQATEGHKS